MKKGQALEVAREYGTPTYLYDISIIQKQISSFKKAFEDYPLHIRYAMKSNSNINILKLMLRNGLGLDTVSIPEIKIGMLAGFIPEQIVFTPNMVGFQEIIDAVEMAAAPNIMGESDKFYALIIGVSSYPDPMIPNLDDHPTHDAEKLSSLLSEQYMFEEEDVTLLVNPNRVDILKSFDLLSRNITPNDNLLIFFAGHGYYDEDANLGYWLPSDAESDFTANWIYNDVLVANLKRIHSKHTLLISDACFSGSIFQTRSMNKVPLAYQKKYDLPSRKAITSGVLEAVPNESIFFRYLADRLSSNPEQYMSAGELFQNLEFPVSNNSPNSPQYGTIQNVDDEGGDFIFIRR